MAKKDGKNKPKKTKRERKVEKELLWIFLFVVFLIIVFVVASAVFKSFNNFDYKGLSFTKEKLGNLTFYHYYYYFVNNNQLTKYNLYLRNDPRTNNVPLEGDNIIFERRKDVYVSLNSTGLQECRFGTLAVASLISFLVDNQIDVKGANLDFWDAGRRRQDWETCETRPENIVISIFEGNETKINIDGNCHEISVANCEILEATERYELESILDAMKTSSRGRVIAS